MITVKLSADIRTEVFIGKRMLVNSDSCSSLGAYSGCEYNQ
jgi:hypothetical protein